MNRIITCEIDKTLVVTPFVSFESGIWVSHNYIAAEDEADSFWVDGFGGNLDDLRNDKIVVTSMIVGTEIYARMLSLDDLRTIFDNAFYWDFDTQKLYVKFTNINPWYIFRTIRAGETQQAINRAQNDSNNRPTNSILGGLVYKVRVIEDSIDASRIEDDLRNNKMVYSPFTFEFDNTDGEYDNIRSEVINLGGRIKLAEVENGEIVTINDLKVIRNGYIDNVTFPDDNTVVFSCSDPRDSLFKLKVNTEKLNTTDYPDLSDNLIDKFKPLAIGNLTNIPTVKIQDLNLDPSDTDVWGDQWLISTSYIVGDVVFNDGDYYVCKSAHTSSASDEPGTGGSWTTYWDLDNDATDKMNFLIGDTQYGNITSVSNVYLNGSYYLRNTSEGRWERESFEGLLDSSQYSINLSTGIITIEKFAGGKISCDCVGTKPTGTDKIIDYIFWFLEEFTGLTYIESFFNITEVDIIRARADNYTGGIYIGTSGLELKEVIDLLTSSINTLFVEQEDRFTMRDLFVDDITVSTRRIKNTELVNTPSRDYDNKRYMSSIIVKYNKDWSENEFSTSLDDSLESDAIEANSLQFTYEFETAIDNKTDADAISLERYTISPPLHLSMEFTSSLNFELYDYVLYELQRRNGTVIEPDALYRVVEINEISRTARLRWITDDIPVDPDYQQGFIYQDKMYNDKLYANTEGQIIR